MPFKSGCCCPQHSEWAFGTVGIKQLLAVTNHKGKLYMEYIWAQGTQTKDMYLL